MAWLTLTMSNLTVKNGLKAKKIKLPQMNFFLKKTTNEIFMCLLAPFILQNLKKLLELILGYEDVPFSGTKWPICPEQNFFGTNCYYYFHLTFSLGKMFKNSYSGFKVVRMCHLWANFFFFGKLLKLFSSTY